MYSLLLIAACMGATANEVWPRPIEPVVRTVDLNVGESREAVLCDGTRATVKLLDVQETRDNLRNAVRAARAIVEVNGQKATLEAANYRLPTTVGGVRIDCAVTKGYVQEEGIKNPWALDKDARVRLWPAGSPWVRPGTFVYPVRQRWFVGDTQMANEPCFVNACDLPGQTPVYYHYGLDFGGAEGLTEVVAATDGVVISVRGKTIDAEEVPSVVKPRGDAVYLRDGRGWYYRYSHLHTIDPAIELGGRVKIGQKIGLVGKEGGSGGWAHLHFEIDAPQPSGRFGASDAYAFVWWAYHRENLDERLQAVARPHRVAWIGEEVTLDGNRSWSADGPGHVKKYEWILGDGTTADGSTVKRRYDRCGEYSETLKITDADGRVDYDFAVVVVYDRRRPKDVTPTIHAVHWPSNLIGPGDEITFKVRAFALGRDEGSERWDFGDGSPAVETRSVPVEVQPDGRILNQHDENGYAAVKHRFAKPGAYIVSVSRTNRRGETATARLHVRVEDIPPPVPPF
ncbi:MAG: peptidoglycan DD-metalloendopeptidase family protein [Pirellulales bacterium]|nr:peptidoglycan DD-metalloendopeptidase family protein [Pirellulales bacterium]